MTFEEKQGEIRAFLGRGEVGDPLRERMVALAYEWSAIANELVQRFGTTLEDGADWQDYEADLAMKDFLFWWTWGN